MPIVNEERRVSAPGEVSPAATSDNYAIEDQTDFSADPPSNFQGEDGENSSADVCQQDSSSGYNRFSASSEDGVVNSVSNHMVAQPGSRVNAFGGRIVAVQGADIRAAMGAHVEFLPGSYGIIEVGTDAKLWPGANVKVVGKIDSFLHVS